MTQRSIPTWLRATLEFGPLIAYLITYLIYRDSSIAFLGTVYSGFVAVTAAFIPVFAICTATLHVLTGRIARLQVFAVVMLILFGGLGLWLNDPKIIKMKPTVAYLALALILWVGLLRKRYWLKFLAQDMVPMHRSGWRILTRRTIILFVLSAAANELVWRTRSETFWVLFETIAMPIIVLGFVLAQIPLVAEHAKLALPKQKKRAEG